MYAVSKVCKQMRVSRSAYYRKSVETRVTEADKEKAVINCFEKNCGNYGRIRIRRDLLRQGIDISEYRIAGILKKNGKTAKSGRKGHPRKPKPTEEQYISENLIADKFSVTAANELWCSDITLIKYKNGSLSLCGIIDVATRTIVGHAIAKHQRQELVQDALLMAVGRYPKRPEGVIYHSDRGCQYTAKRTKDLIEKNGFRRSMSRPGTPSDNQPIESFWRTLKSEVPDVRHLGFEQACGVIVSYIEMYYNSDRIHSGISYYIPYEMMRFLTV